MWVNGAFEFETNLVLLTEGRADKAFIRALIRAQELPDFDCPWPVSVEDDHSGFLGANKLHGRDKFGGMLEVLDVFLNLRPELCDRLRGVLIVTDARDDPDDSFRHVCDQIAILERFGVPTAPLDVALSKDGRPPIAVMLFPGDGRGSLETICIEDMKTRKPIVFEAMQTYLSTDPIAALSWSTEKSDKARLHCMIAATNERDPTKSLQYAFSSDTPIIDAGADCFLPVSEKIKSFCRAVGVG